MKYSEREPKPDLSRKPESRTADSPIGGAPVYGLPNSLMADMLSDDNGGDIGSASIIRRQMNMPHRQIPSAEAEADLLSAGIRSTTPDAVRREMGSRLNADLSEIRFHSDADSLFSNAQMGSRAWTSGQDVYFGKGGFEPQIAAHELVHTVQQGVVRGSVSQSVAPGTVQMFWPFSKRRSNFDEDRTPEDIADNLFRIQAGYTATEEREKEERDAEYAKAYDSELKRLTRAGRGRIQEEGNEEQNQENARNTAAQRAANLRVKKKEYVNNSDKDKFLSQIMAISKETYKELLDRRKRAAEELVNYFNETSARNNLSADQNLYTAAKSNFANNFVLYNQLITKIEMAHSTRADFQEWKNELQPDNEDENEPVERAKIIMRDGLSADNSYLKSEAGIRNRSEDDWRSKEYYKKVYAKKKTKLDRMASKYRKRKKSAEQSNAGINLIDEQPIREKPDNNIISNGDQISEDSFYLEGLPENEKKNGTNSSGKKTENIISGGMKESEDSLSDNHSEIESDSSSKISENIISTSTKEEGKDAENSVSNSTVKQKVEEYISTASNQKGMPENDGLIENNDENRIIRQSVLLTDLLTDNFSPAGPTVNGLKNKTGKSGFVNNVAKGANNLNLFTLALINQRLLNEANAYKDYVNPAISGGIGGLTALTGLAGTITGAADTIRNFHNVDAGGSRWDYINSGTDTLGSASNMAVGGMTVAKNMVNVPLVGETMKKISEFGGANMVPGLSIAAGGASLLTGAIEGIRGQKSINKIDSQIKALDGMSGKNPTEDQVKLMQIFNQGRRVSELHRTGGGIKAVGGGIALGTGIALLSGPLAPITAAVLGIAGAGAGIASFIYGRSKKKSIRKGVTAEEMGFDNWEDEIERVKAQFPGEKLSDKETIEIILKGNGYDVKTRKDAFKQINMNRAKMLLEIAKGNSPMSDLAEKVINALGVSRKNGRFAGGAQKLIAEKLGG